MAKTKRGPKSTQMMARQRRAVYEYAHRHNIPHEALTTSQVKMVWLKNRAEWDRAAALKDSNRGYASSISLHQSILKEALLEAACRGAR